MTTRTILLTLAATVAPLYARQPASPAPAAQAFTSLAALPAPATATAEQRAQVFNALALLPPNISDAAVLTNVGGNLLKLAESGKLPEFSPGDVPAELLALDNIALASTPATPATYALLQHALVSLSTVQSTLELSEGWTEDARAELRDAIIEELLLRADAATAQPDNAAEGTRIPAGYVILTSRPGEEAMLKECSSLLLADLQGANQPGITPVNEVNGFSGIRMDVTETYKEELDEATKGMAPRRREQLLDELAKHPLHILTRLQGNALIIATCENPQELHLAATPAESLLGTNKLAACDANLGRGMIAASFVSPELANIGSAFHSQPGLHLMGGIGAVFTRLAEAEPANKEAYEKAAAAAAFMGAELQKLTRPVTQPSFMQMWCDGDLHLVATCDAQGCTYAPGALRLASMAAAPETALYVESTPLQTGLTPPDTSAVIDAAFALAEGFALTLDGDDGRKVDNAIGTVKAFAPELRSLAAAGSTICSGLNGQVAFVMDSAYTPIPPVAGAHPGTEAHAPRFALYAGVSDRSKLGSGWEELRTSAAQMAVKLGAPGEIIDFLPITEKQMGAATSYSLTLPFFTQDAVPSIAVTDTGLTLGSSVNLTTQVAQNATGTTPFAGGVFALRFEPLARTLRSLATALDHDAEEAEPVATSNVRLEKDKGVVIATVGGEDGPTSVFLSTTLAAEDDTADKLSTAAAVFEFASSIAEGMYGSSTIENGTHTLHVRVKMK